MNTKHKYVNMKHYMLKYMSSQLRLKVYEIYEIPNNILDFLL